MPQIILGIDVGSYSVKVAELQRSFKTFQFVNFYERRVLYNDVLTPEESIATALQAVLEDNALTWDSCFAALPGRDIATRLLEMPFGNPKKVEQTLPFEVENHIPFFMDDIVLASHVGLSTKDFSRVLICYARKTEVARCLSFMNNANIEPKRLCAAGVELINLVVIGLSPPDGTYAILDVGHTQLTITICQGRRLMYTRTITIGGQQITQAVARAIDVADDEAERLKIELGQAPADSALPEATSIPNKITRAIGETLQEMVLHLRQTFFTYREQTGDMVEGLYLCGGTTRLPGIADFFSRQLKQNVTMLDCHDFHFTQLDRTDAEAAVACTALAIALRGVAPPGLPLVNFRQGEFVYRADTQQLESRVRRAALAAGLIVALGATYFGLRWYGLSQQLEQRNREIFELVRQALPKDEAAKVSGADSALAALKKLRSTAENKINAVQTVLATSALNVLKRYSQAVPSRDEVKLNVEEFEYTPEITKVKTLLASGTDVDRVRDAIEKALVERPGSDPKKPQPPGDGGEGMQVQFLPAKPNPKGGLWLEMVMQPRSAIERAEREKKEKRHRSNGSAHAEQ